jgi:hypothetical protein
MKAPERFPVFPELDLEIPTTIWYETFFVAQNRASMNHIHSLQQNNVKNQRIVLVEHITMLISSKSLMVYLFQRTMFFQINELPKIW